MPYSVTGRWIKTHLQHIFKCIDPWLMEKGSCPQCKVDVLKQLGLRDSTNFATGPEETTNDATLAPPHRDLVGSDSYGRY